MAATLDQDFPQLTDTKGKPELTVIAPPNNFERFAAIDCKDQIEKKNGLSYLSWAWAVDRLLRLDPGANWAYGEPVMFCDTMMVSCAVTAFGKTMTSHLPVMDYKNRAIANPDSFAVNTAMQRCLVKAIALHGLGLYIYAGEDLPYSESEDEKASKPKSVAGEEWDKLDKETQDWMLNEAMAVAVLVGDGDVLGAYQHIESLQMDADYKTAFWSRLDATQRSAIKACASILHAKDQAQLIKAWGAVPKHSQAALTALKDQRKAELA